MREAALQPRLARLCYLQHNEAAERRPVNKRNERRQYGMQADSPRYICVNVCGDKVCAP